MKITLLSNGKVRGCKYGRSLSTIEDYTTLKPSALPWTQKGRLSTIEDYTTLKLSNKTTMILTCLSTIEDYTTLKRL